MIVNTVHGSASCPVWHEIRKSRKLLAVFDDVAVRVDRLGRRSLFETQAARTLFPRDLEELRKVQDAVNLLFSSMVGSSRQSLDDNSAM